MDTNITGKVALVTGASAGIGRATALALAREGAQVVVTARRAALLEELSAEMQVHSGAHPILSPLDIMRPKAASELAQAALERTGHVDILVNCAGGSRRVAVDASDDVWDESFVFNFTRARQLTQALLPAMTERRWGRIVNITGKSEPDHMNVAWAVKAAMHGWAKALSREVGPHGITVNSVAPGKIMSEQILAKYSREELDRYAMEAPVREIGRPEDVANLVTYLASPLARYITGTVIPVDGGLRRYAF